MNLQELQGLLAQAEDERLEFKPHTQPGEAAKIIAALANSEGGNLVIGVDENRPVPLVGVANPQQVEGMLYEAASSLHPPVTITVSQQVIDGKHIVVAEIPDSLDTPHFYQGVAYERYGEHTLPVTAGRITTTSRRRLGEELIPADSKTEEEVLREVARLARLVESLNKQLSESRALRVRLSDLMIGGAFGAVMSVILSLIFL